MQKKPLIYLASVILCSCGGGGDSSSGNDEKIIPLDDGNSSIPPSTSSSVNLEFGDAITGTKYRVENFTARIDDNNNSNITVTENDAVKGSQIDVIWFTKASDNSGENLTTYQYTADVYLSNDSTLDSSDQKLFSLSCDAPVSTNDPNPCSSQGYVRCVYANNSDPVLSCSTIPPQASEGFQDKVIDISAYFSLGNPTSVSFITQVCLPNEPASCSEQSAQMTLH